MPNQPTHDPQHGGEMTAERYFISIDTARKIAEHPVLTDEDNDIRMMALEYIEDREQEIAEVESDDTRSTLSPGDAEPLTGTPLRVAVIRSKYPQAIYYRGIGGCNSAVLNTNKRPWFAIAEDNHGNQDEAVDAAALWVLAEAGYTFHEANDQGGYQYSRGCRPSKILETLRLAQEAAMRNHLKRTAPAISEDKR